MEYYFFYTEVTWCWWEENKRKTAREAVIVFAQSHSHAAGILEENYGDELLSIDKIEIISENTLPLSIAAGHALRDAAINYGKAEVVEEKDCSVTPKQVHWNPNTTPFPADTPQGTVIICDTSDSTYAQNWEGVAP